MRGLRWNQSLSVEDIEQLAAWEVAELSQWFEEFQAQLWDKHSEQEARGGRFDAIIEQVR